MTAGTAAASHGAVTKRVHVKDAVSAKAESLLRVSLSSESVSEGLSRVPGGHVSWLVSAAGWEAHVPQKHPYAQGMDTLGF